MLKAYHRYIIEDVTRNYNLNQPATRAEVFGFGRNIMNKKNIFFKANSEYTNIYFSFLYPSKHYVFSADTNTGILQNTVVQEKNKSITI